MSLRSATPAGLVIALLSLFGGCSSGVQTASTPTVQTAVINGVRLAYTEAGAGEPVVFIHGGLMDYREWQPTIRYLPAGYRSIAYSRRYNYPNDNPLLPDHSALVEADDVAALISHLKLKSAHIVGVSYGGLTALHLASNYPNLVRSVTVAEPALLAWLREIPDGRDALNDFMQHMWQPAGDAFRAGESDRALRVTVDYFAGAVGAYDQIPVDFKTALHANLKEWEALTTSRSAFAAVSRSEIQRLRVPVMILTGEKTKPIFKLITAELAQVTPDAVHIVIPGGTHDMCSEQPQACATAINQFIEAKGGLTSR